MPDYDWRTRIDVTWMDRFPEWAIGYMEWQEYRGSYLRRNGESPTDYLIALWERPELRSRILCPRIFISHRRDDEQFARRVAWIAKGNGFDYWLDVEDPLLDALEKELKIELTGHQKSLAVACVIEMALLNCTHVVAVMTPETPGSRWVPYEFGRVKDKRLVSLKAGSWVHPHVASSSLPEYLHLGQVTYNEQELDVWLKDEFRRWTLTHRSCLGGSRSSWGETVPPSLP